jgi:hypothetical protein
MDNKTPAINVFVEFWLNPKILLIDELGIFMDVIIAGFDEVIIIMPLSSVVY